MFTITLKKFIIFISFFILVHKGYSTIYYSQGSLDPTSTTNWNILRTGGVPAGRPANFTSGDIFVIQNAHSMNPTVLWTVSGTNAEIQLENGGTLNISSANVTTQKLTVLSGGITTIVSSRTLTVNNGNASGDDLSVTGTLTNAGTFTYGTSATGIINNGGLFQHAQNGGAIITATWSSGSTCEITGITGTDPTGLNQSFHHFIWNCTSQSSNRSLNGSLTSVAGNFTLTSANAKNLSLNNSASAIILTLGGDLIIQSGNFDLSASTGSGTINLSGNFNMSGGNIRESNSGGASIVFVSSGVQTYTKSGGTFSATVDITVNSGCTLDMGTNIFNGSTGTFTLSSGATIKIGSASGITSSGATGNIQVTTRTFNTGANYIYTGANTQVFGNGLPSTVNNLTVNNANTAMALNGAQTINGILTLTSGKIAIGANTLSLNGNFVGDATNCLTGSASSNITIGGSGTIGNLFFNQTTPGTTNNISTFTMNRASQTVTLGSNITVGTTLTLTTGKFGIGANTLTLNGTFSGSATNSLSASGTSSNLTIGGSGAIGTLFFDQTTISTTNRLLNLSVNRSSQTITVGNNFELSGTSNVVVTTSTLALNSATLNVYGTISNAGTISLTSSSIIFNNGSKYQHNQNGGTIPTSTWSTGSTCEITGATNTVPSGIAQSFHHFTWNSSAQSVGICLCGGFTTTINGVFTVQQTNSQELRLANGSSFVYTFNDDLNVSSTGIFNMALGVGKPYVILKGNLTVSGTLTATSGGGGTPTISFTNSTTKTFTNTGTISNLINVVDSIGTVDFGTNILSGTGTFTILSGATMLIGSTAGITASGATGNIQLTGTRTYNTGANYSYTGSSSQVFGNGLPSTVNNLTVNNGNTAMALNGSQTINGTLTLTSGKISIGANTLTLNGDFSGSTSNTLKANGASSNLTISGSGTIGNLYFDQTTSGTTNRLQNLTINRSAQTITLGNTLEVSGTITPTAGTLATGGTLTLVSNSSGTARIATGSGSYISGNVKVQRFISSVGRRWRYMGSTITNATLEDWRGEIFVTGNNSPSADQSNTVGGSLNWGFDAIQSTASTVYFYDETIITGNSNNGWTAVTNSTSSLTNVSLTVGKGYRVFVRGDRSSNSRLNGTDNTQNAVTMDLNGPVNTGNITMPVTFTSSGTVANDGWCLLTNPYPSPYDWDAFWAAGNSGFNGTNYTNIDPTIYIFDATSNSYKSYNASSHSGTLTSGIIPLGCSFFVKATGSSPAITFVETYKSGSTPIGLYKTSNNANELTIKLSYDLITSDDCMIKNLPTSSKKYELNDILKLNNPEVNISSYLADSTNLSLNCAPLSADLNDTIYLNVTGKLSSTYNMYFDGVDSFANDKNIFLYDDFLNTITDLHKQKSYSFDIDINNTFTFGKDRFKIILTKNQLTGIENITPQNQVKFSLFPNPSTDKIAIQSNIKLIEKLTYEVLDINGKTIVSSALVSSSNNENYLDISSLQSGIYFIHILSAGQHSSVLKFIKE